ncbi:MAG: AmmeMemoRadiSam system protein B [Thermoplasmata archaeon]|nr:AmmeMemoRadiSam system protein B [Thermoplasmata archaeon]
MRYPTVAGQFYAGNAESLDRQIRDCYLSPIGPGDLPELNKDGPRKIKGIVSPHAGFMFSGPVAAHGFKALAEDGFPEVFIIIGPNHTGMGKSIGITDQDFQTPLGKMENHKDLAERIRGGNIDMDIASHRHEHSLEVQLPFIQFFQTGAKFVPITMMLQDIRSAVEVGKRIREATKGMDAVIIASSDLSHYVSPDIAREKDMLAIDKVLDLDMKGFYSTITKHRISACGYGPIIAMMEATQGTEAKLLKYATSGDVTPMAEVVGYASIVVK